jgi:hypothetical protein
MSSTVNAIVYLPVVTGALSLVGSSLIILSIFRARAAAVRRNSSSADLRRSSLFRHRRRGQASHVYQRIMIAMSVHDIVYTLFSAMLGLLFRPPELDRGHGTRFTCTLQGFFIQWGMGLLLMVHG